MRIIRAYIDAANKVNQVLPLPASTFQHLIKVLRLSDGAQIEVFNGRGERFAASLCNIAKKTANLKLTESLEATPESPLHTRMGLVMSKGDRFDYALQKATELGVTSITPLTSERCDLKLNAERAEKKMTHWQGVISSACEQCYRDTIPVLYPVDSLQNWINIQDSDIKLVFHTTASEPAWPQLAPKSISFLVGPEGGLTEQEVESAHQRGFASWQLGPRILRTETAPIVILSLLQMKWGDFYLNP
ncbi:MAG: 16S rRNA (uracil(1498)-N(3))-methyltransferase [Reinekea sp.]